MSYKIINTAAAAAVSGLNPHLRSAVILLGTGTVLSGDSEFELNIQRDAAAALVGVVEDEILELNTNTIPQRLVTPVIEVLHNRLVELVRAGVDEADWEDESVKGRLYNALLDGVPGLRELVLGDSDQAIEAEEELKADQPPVDPMEDPEDEETGGGTPERNS